MAQYGSKIDQYADKEFAGDELYSNTNRDDPAMQASRERRKQGNREWKGAVRDSKSRDPRVQALGFKTARDMMNAGHQPQTGIPGQGEFDGQDRKYADKHTRDGLVLEEQARKRAAAELGNNSPASSQVPPAGASDAPASGAGGPPTTPTGQGATPGAPTPPAAPSGAGNGKLAAPDWKQKRDSALKTNKFGNDITSWATSEDKEGKPTRDELNKYGETLGISSDQIEAQVEKAVNQAATKNKEDAPLPEGTGLLGGDYRTSTERDKDAISGRDGERSIVTDKDKAWMSNLEASSDKPKDAVSLYEGAYNRYQKGVGSESGAYNKADFEEMRKIREGASPAELSVINRISSGKGSTLSATETQHTEGNYKGSNKQALETYQSLLNSPQYTESDPDGKKRINAINGLYGKLNGLDQAKSLGMDLKKSSDLLKSQREAGLIDEHGKMTQKLRNIEAEEGRFYK